MSATPRGLGPDAALLALINERDLVVRRMLEVTQSIEATYQLVEEAEQVLKLEELQGELFRRRTDIDFKIASTIAATANGIKAQAELLLSLAEPGDLDDPDADPLITEAPAYNDGAIVAAFCRSILAGLERIER